MTLVASPKVPDSQLTSCARLPEKTKYLCARESGDNQVGTAGLPEDVLDITTSLKEHHLKLLVRSPLTSDCQALLAPKGAFAKACKDIL